VDRRPRRDQVDDGAIERRPEIGVTRHDRLNVLRAADGIADIFEVEIAEVPEIVRELWKRDAARGTLVAKRQKLEAAFRQRRSA